MDRLIGFNIIATSGRAVEAAGDVDTLLLDKTGTITYGNRLWRNQQRKTANTFNIEAALQISCGSSPHRQTRNFDGKKN